MWHNAIIITNTQTIIIQIGTKANEIKDINHKRRYLCDVYDYIFKVLINKCSRSSISRSNNINIIKIKNVISYIHRVVYQQK